MWTTNDLICTAPFPNTGIALESRASGLKQMANYSALTPLKVLVDAGHGIRAGAVVYVSGKDVKAPWALARFKLPSGDECIFVPKSSVFMVVGAIEAEEAEEAKGAV